MHVIFEPIGIFKRGFQHYFRRNNVLELGDALPLNFVFWTYG